MLYTKAFGVVQSRPMQPLGEVSVPRSVLLSQVRTDAMPWMELAPTCTDTTPCVPETPIEAATVVALTCTVRRHSTKLSACTSTSAVMRYIPSTSPCVFQGEAKPVAAAPAAGNRAAGGPPGVEVTRVKTTRLQDDAQAVGSLNSRQAVTLKPETAGRVARIAFKDGQGVKRGQLLVQLDDTLQRAELSQAQAQLSIAQANLKRNRELVAENFVAQRVVDESMAALQVITEINDRIVMPLIWQRAEASVEQAEAGLRYDAILARAAPALSEALGAAREERRGRRRVGSVTLEPRPGSQFGHRILPQGSRP